MVKSCNLLQLVSGGPNSSEELKILEMSLNKEGILIDKSKLVIVKLDKLFVILPITITKVEVRMRNVILNQRQKMESISKFIAFYLEQYEKQDIFDKEQAKAIEKKEQLQKKQQQGKPKTVEV